jgi:hypothetical protein
MLEDVLDLCNANPRCSAKVSVDKTTTTQSGEFIRPDLIPRDLTLANSLKQVEGEDKRLFLDFIKKMLRWRPEERSSAKELLTDAWLES